MNAYEQAVAGREMAQREITQIEEQLAAVQRDYATLTTTVMAETISSQERERERTRLAQQLKQLLVVRRRWLAARDEAEHAMQRELERVVHSLRGEVVHLEQTLP